MLEEILKFLIEAGSLTGLLVLLGRKLIDNSFSKNLEKYKAELEKQRYEHQIKYSTLHEARAMVIRDLFTKIVKAEKSMSSLVAIFEPVGQPPKEEKAKIAATDFNNLADYFTENEIYLSERVAGLFNKVSSNIRDAWYEFMKYPSYKQTPNYFLNPEIVKVEQEKIKSWGEAWKKMREDLPPLKNELKKELQKILGVD